MKRILIYLLLLLTSTLVYSQEHRHALGIRGGFSSGVEFRQYFSDNTSGKLYLSYCKNGLQLHGLFEFHRTDLFSFTDHLDFIYGAGLYGGYQRWNKIRKEGMNEYMDTATGIIAGLDGLLGLEFNMDAIPLSVGLEVEPFLEAGGEAGLNIIPWDLAFTIKYLF